MRRFGSSAAPAGAATAPATVQPTVMKRATKHMRLKAHYSTAPKKLGYKEMKQIAMHRTGRSEVL